MKKLTLTDLKKHLAQKTKEELILEIATLYQRIPEGKEYFQVQGGDAREVAQKYKDIIEKEFGGKGRSLPKARLSVGKKAVNDFKKLTKDPELIADVMLTYVESVSSFNGEYGVRDEDYYTSPENMFENALAIIRENNLLTKFKSRAQEIVKDATEGYGHYDSLKERYEEVYGELK